MTGLFPWPKSEKVMGLFLLPVHDNNNSSRQISPLLNNIGYVVITLKQEKDESKMPDWISGNLTATIYYDIEKAYGVGKSEYYLPVMSDGNWTLHYNDYNFWEGKGYIRVKDINNGVAKIDLYTDENNVYRSSFNR